MRWTGTMGVIVPKNPMESKILAVMTDLFFLVKIQAIAKRAGMAVEVLTDQAAILGRRKAAPALVIIDLNCRAADPVGLIRGIKADPETSHARIVGFVSHVETDLRRSAEEAGCDQVFARSAFERNLPGVLEELAA